MDPGSSETDPAHLSPELPVVTQPKSLAVDPILFGPSKMLGWERNIKFFVHKNVNISVFVLKGKRMFLQKSSLLRSLFTGLFDSGLLWMIFWHSTLEPWPRKHLFISFAFWAQFFDLSGDGRDFPKQKHHNINNNIFVVSVAPGPVLIYLSSTGNNIGN